MYVGTCLPRNRELGYRTEEDHIRDCKEAEYKKRKQILLTEKEDARLERAQFSASNSADELNDDNSKEYAEEDEEMEMARKLEQSEQGEEDGPEVGDEDSLMKAEREPLNEEELKSSVDDDAQLHDEDADGQLAPKPEDKNSPILLSSPGGEVTTEISNRNVVNTGVLHGQSEGISCTENQEEKSPEYSNTASVVHVMNDIAATQGTDFMCGGQLNHGTPSLLESSNVNKDNKTNDVKLSEETSLSQKDDSTSSKKPRNSAWKAMLKKEKELIARQKMRQRNGGSLVDGEAEEEEEEEGILGLEDFGFAVQKKNDDNEEDETVEADEDDLDHVVDDVSDGEGDEEAGEEARKRLEAQEEKERHKEIMRKMREGYDGRRGGIAAGGARGLHRFDQLVAADNRDDAKRLGLLNDDELNSEDEGEGVEGTDSKKNDEEDDEAALLDKMLKERFLHRQDENLLEEHFTDDEEDEEEADETGEFTTLVRFKIMLSKAVSCF